jgi:hypothetical protein
MSDKISIAVLRRLPGRTVRDQPAQASPLRVSVYADTLLALVEAVEAARGAWPDFGGNIRIGDDELLEDWLDARFDFGAGV